MRILHLNTEHTWRGGEAQLLHLAEGLSRRGKSCLVVGQPDSEILKRARDKGLETEAIPMPSEWSLTAVLRLRRILKKKRIQIIHMHTSHACALGGWAARLARVPVRVISRRVDFSVRSNPLRHLKYGWGVDRIIAISKGVRDVLIRDGLNPNRIEVIHSGINPESFDPAYPAGEARAELGIAQASPVVGCIAHFADHKGHRYLIEAARQVVSAVPDTRFLLVGEGELKYNVELMIKKLALDNHFILTGFRLDIQRLLSAMDLVVLSSHQEGLGTSLLDAMAMARPVVATRVGGIPEMIEDGVNGRLVSPRDPAALADGMIELLKDPEKRKRMGEAGRARVMKSFSANAMVSATEALYQKLLAEKVGGSGG